MEATRTQLLYEAVAGEVVGLIEGGALQPGDRLPSVRQLGRERGVSVATVLQAYRTLEDRGWVEARPQSGHYVRVRAGREAPVPAKTRPSGAAGASGSVPACSLAMEVVEAAEEAVAVPLGAAVVAPALLPVRALNRELGRVVRSENHAHLGYLHPQGGRALREEVARRSLYWGGALTPDDLVVTAGCMEALALALGAVTRPGDVVAVESPAYFGVLQLLGVLGLRALEVPSRPLTGVCLDDLADALDAGGPVAACLLTPNYQNPLGGVIPDGEKARLVALLAERGVPLVEDDIYGDLHHGPRRPPPCKAFDREGTVLYCSSFSKTVAPGLRVGYVAPGRYLDAVRQRKAATSVTTAAAAQLALAAYLRRGGYDHHLRRLRATLAENTARLRAAVSEHFPEGTRASRPEGGFVLWVELPEGTDAVALYRAARAEGITTVPGPAFSATGAYGHCLRLSAGHPWDDAAEGGVRRLGALSRLHARGAPS